MPLFNGIEDANVEKNPKYKNGEMLDGFLGRFGVFIFIFLIRSVVLIYTRSVHEELHGTVECGISIWQNGDDDGDGRSALPSSVSK